MLLAKARNRSYRVEIVAPTISWDNIPSPLPNGTSHDMLQYLNDPFGDVTTTRAMLNGLPVEDTTAMVYTPATGLLEFNSVERADVYMEADFDDPLVSFTVNGSGTGAITFGHVFAEGDATDVNVTGMQREIKTTWADGSVRFAIFSGILDGGQSYQINIGAGAAGTNLTEAQLITALGTTTIQVSGGATGTVNCADLISGAATPSGFGVLDWQDGPFCIERVVGAQLSGTIYGYFHARYYSNGSLSVDFVVENAEAISTGASAVGSVTVTFTLAGTQVYSDLLTIYANSRFMETRWSPADPGLSMSPDVGYFYSTNATPKYIEATTPVTHVQSVAPYALGNHRDAYGDTGYSIQIGPLPEWDVAAIRNAFTPSTINSVIANSKAAAHRPVNLKDNSTGYPVDLTTYTRANNQGWTPNDITLGGGASVGANSRASHMPSNGYLAYILTGQYYHLENLWYWANWGLMYNESSTSINDRGAGLRVTLDANQKRTSVWTLRTVSQAAFIGPSSHAQLNDGFVTSVTSTVDWIRDDYINGANANIFGWIDDYDAPSQTSPWQNDWLVALLNDCQRMGLGGANVGEVCNWLAPWIENRISSQGVTDWCWQFSPIYNHNGQPGDNGSYTTSWIQYFQNVHGAQSCNLSGLWDNVTNRVDATYYSANMRWCVSSARDNGYLLDADWDRFIGGFTTADFDADPVWGTIPRSAGTQVES